MLRIVAVAFLAGTGVAVWPASSSQTASGVLAGRTQISFGCPGPVSEGSPTCDPWRTFPDARFSVARRGADGQPAPGTSRLLTSDATGRFRVRLRTGPYLVTPLPQAHTYGGPRLSVRVRAGEVRTILVRFVGYPQMLSAASPTVSPEPRAS